MNRTVLVIGIIFLLICASIVTSTENIVEDTHIDYQTMKSIIESKEELSRGEIAYSYIAYGGQEGPCYFPLVDPGDITELPPFNCPGFLCSTWTNYGKMLVCDGNSVLWEINLCNFTASEIGSGDVSLNGLAYNPVDDKLYGVTSSELYKINIFTGEQTYIGSFGLSGKTIIAIAINWDGRAFIWDVLFSGSSTLWEVDLETGEATKIGEMGINLLYVSDGAFDWETGILWLTAYSSTGFLATVDIDTGELTNMGNFGVELCSLAIPQSDDFCPPVTTHSLDPPESDGENGWYVSDVTVTLTAVDYKSGVKEIKYKVDGGATQTIVGDNGTFLITQADDMDDVPIEYWAYDNAGNEESPHNEFTMDTDQTVPIIDLTWKLIEGNPCQGWLLEFTATCSDATSGMDRVEFYLNEGLQDTVYGSGPEYQWEWRYFGDISVDIIADAYDIAGNMASDIADGRDKTTSNVLLSAYNIEKDEDCDCETVSEVDVNRLERTIDRIEGYTKILSLYSKQYPEYKKISEEINNRISTLKGRIQEIKYYPPVQKLILCFITLMLFLPFWTLANIIANIPVDFDSIFYNIHRALMFLCLLPAGYFYNLGNFLECKWIEYVFDPFEENSLINP